MNKEEKFNKIPTILLGEGKIGIQPVVDGNGLSGVLLSRIEEPQEIGSQKLINGIEHVPLLFIVSSNPKSTDVLINSLIKSKLGIGVKDE